MSERNDYYYYTPSLAAAALFTAVFTTSALGHAIQLTRTRTWYFLPMFIGATMEAIGYIARTQSHKDKEKMAPYIVQAILLLVAPALLAASIYMVLGRLMTYLDAAHHSAIRIKWLTKFFVAGDVLSFLMQTLGGAMLARADEDSANLGQKLILGGLFVQILFFGGFLVVLCLFHLRIKSAPTETAISLQRNGRNGWMTLLTVLYASGGFIMVRSMFRVIEYIQGHNGYLLRNEVWLYIFDATLISAAVIPFNFVHPSNVIVPENRKGFSEGAEGLQGAEMEMSPRHHQ